MKYQHFETESGQKIKKAHFDGYLIAEKLLEGIMFQVSIQEDGSLDVSVNPEDQEAFENFNQEKFLKQAIEFVENEGNEFTDPVSNENCWLVKETEVSKNDTEQKEEKEEETIIGEFKPRREFLNFVQGRRGGVRFLSKEAYIEGSQLSGMLEDTKFKVTICDEGTINFEEVGDKNLSNKEMIKRFIDDIDSSDVTGYMEKYIIFGFDFKDENGKTIYLEVKEQKPIDKLFSIFDEKDEKDETKPQENMNEAKISDKGASLLDSLFQDEEENDHPKSIIDSLLKKSEQKETEEEKPPMTFAQQMISESFEKMNAEKIDELQTRADKKESEMIKYQNTYKSAKTSFESCQKDLKVLRSRLEDMKPKAQPNGIVFYVSPENKSDLEVDDNLKKVVKVVSENLKLKEDVVLELVTEGYYTIKLCGKDDISTPEEYQIDKETFQQFKKLKMFGKLTMVGNNEFNFRGDLTWHQIVEKLINWGFEQDETWDEACGSPSYKSNESIEEKHSISADGGFLVTEVYKNKESNSDKEESNNNDEASETENTSDAENTEYEPKILTSFKNETIVLVDATTSEGDFGRGLEINDDESSFSIYVDKKKHGEYTCFGFVNVLTLKEFEKFKKIPEYEDAQDYLDGAIIPNFTGDIEVVVKGENGKFLNDFDTFDYISHQFDEYVEVGLNLPEGTQVFDLERGLEYPKQVIRDFKIDEVLSELKA